MHHVGPHRAAYVLKQLEARAQQLGLAAHAPPYSAYQNTISLAHQAAHPGDVALEERITAIIRWNALAMVVRANQAYGELGGHIASYASAAEIFEIGFNHFFRAGSTDRDGDLVFFQPHSAPGVYARAFLEGRLSEEQLGNFRQEVGGHGLCSYPHPWLMPRFWQFPTGQLRCAHRRRSWSSDISSASTGKLGADGRRPGEPMRRARIRWSSSLPRHQSHRDRHSSTGDGSVARANRRRADPALYVRGPGNALIAGAVGTTATRTTAAAAIESYIRSLMP